VGLTPKLFCRVSRFQRVIERMAARPSESWVDRAMFAGYSDQPHFIRQFREFAGLTPREYHSLAPALPNHVPVPNTSIVR
jgi:methylphosphotriester-DNA--protein-cysteine methyltransferase